MQPKRRKQIIWATVIVLVALAGYFAVRYFIGRRPFMYAGTLETTKVVLSSRVASDISEFFVIEGDTVSRDQPLLEMSCDVYKIMARQIDNDFARAAALKERGHMSAAEYDVLSRNKQDNDLKLDWCRVRSPMDGMVITKFREVGEVVAPGAPLVSIANPYDIWAYFYVPYSVLYKLKVGQSVVGILTEANNMRFPGRIIKISEVAEFTPKNVQTRDERTRLVYGIKVRFDNQDLILKSGMTIESNLTDEQ